MRKLVLLSAIILLLATSAWSQRICGTMDHLQMQLQQDPTVAQRMQEIETFTQNYLANHPSGERTLITIPVVVHVLYNTSAQNISDAKVQAQIAQLNADYARTNSDAGNTPSVWSSTAANCEVQFCLAQRDPAGNATNGIIHKSTTTTSFSSNDNVKHNSTGGDDAWSASSYLNLWSCNLGGGLLGYAQFPGGSASTDGVVVLYSSIGSIASPGTAVPYDKGRTATHEVGHWLNLYHIWGDDGTSCSGTDNVADTPNQSSENYGCPAFPHTDACSSGNGVMFMNYMDYTDDACMNMFTAGQKSRMQALFVSGGSRFAMVSSQGCVPPSGGTCSTPSGLNVTSITSTSATLNWSSVSGANSYNVQYRVVGNATWTSTTSATNSKAISSLTSSTQYEFQVQTVCTSGNSAFSSSTNFTTLPSGGGTYCASNGNSQAYEFIDNVSIGSISRTSGADAGGYYNGTALSTNVSQGSSYTLTYSAGFTGSSYAENWKAYVDWNGDGDFADAGEAALTATSSGSGNNTGTIAVPSTATIGTTRMRISMQYGSSPAACGSFAEGEVEDYSLNIQAGGGSCSNTPEPNNTIGTASPVTVGIDFLSQIGTSTDVDWYSFSNTTTNHNIKVTLGTLPGDYDIKLYNPTGSNVATSQLGGTSSETIIYNTSTVGTFKIRVYGYAGAFSSTVCYTLHVYTSANPFRYENGADGSINPDKADITVFPNPAFDNMTVLFNSAEKNDVVLNVYNLLGKKMYSTSFLALEGQNTFNMSVNNFDKGVYFIEVASGTDILKKEFIVTK